MKTVLGVVLALAFSSFIANGNGFNIITANLSIIGTVLIALFLILIVKPSNIKDIQLSKQGFFTAAVYLTLLYVVTFIVLLPEKIPSTVLPYVTIILSYVLFIWLFVKTKKEKLKVMKLTKKEYSIKELTYFLILVLFFTNLACLVPPVSMVIFVISYISFAVLGAAIFILFLNKKLFHKT